MSDVGTLTLADFLLARIAEDEAAARAASREGGTEPDTSWWWAVEVPGPTMQKTPDDETHTVIDSPGCLITYEVCRDSFAEHIARHDPARVLANCEAKRRIVELHPARQSTSTADWYGEDEPTADMLGCGECGSFGEYTVAWPCKTLRALALPYADHPDYRDEWRP